VKGKIVKKIRISGRGVGGGEPCFIIAEAGVNHNGKFQLAKRMIDAAKKAGADAIKFQVFKVERLVTKTAPKAKYQKMTTGKGSQHKMLKKLELTEKEFKKLAAHAKRKKIIFLASAFDEESVDLLDDIGVPAFKVPSGEITNFPMLKQIADKGKPIILSTGMSTIGEIAEALKVIKKGRAKDIILLHCTSDYPAQVEEVNLRAMETLRRKFGVPVGLSDHTVGIAVPAAAAALGAVMIEKHFTLNKNLSGPDHKASLEPRELQEMVSRIRRVEKAMGSGIKKPTKSEEATKMVVRKSIVARVDIPKGTVINKKMLDVKRPGTGLEPKYMEKIVGRKARTNIKADELITFEKLV
jgi:N-acetylneuraminate synthase/N,N'-diacetyllegionaminate synthase